MNDSRSSNDAPVPESRIPWPSRCTKDVAGFRTGEIVKLDHELGELEKAFASLLDFVMLGCRDWE